ncbi:putative peptidoglycan/LOS O-acetylase, OafA/YrhL family [Arcobacter venerupis]|uniref:Peptidoglycan/LOS O-acetylase, OafA/YrhL family n=1 Tax=Arcobacter venerupis TaxID=1054033 RepID=A0AAE7B9D3_9BACT|nr:acyltransferase [Arcobacter venerupis]QKF67011.1 putative peptidoglycan/LOS O-acetylase, OafA/YrhL family [Arcobacter venerupis]RWS50042.1 acyltransferase [Arcobacter venerupis]
MPITLTDDIFRTNLIVIAILIAVVLFTFSRTKRIDLFPIPVTQELKGLGILTVVFAHFAYMLVTNADFLFPLSIIAGVGVDLFLFMSGYGLTVGMLKKPLPLMDFYKRRAIKIFIPFWVVTILIFAANAIFLNIHYPVPYMLQSLIGWFPTARGFDDVNSPFWYITWMMMFYILFPIVFSVKKPWLSALILAVIATLIGVYNPLELGDNWLHRLHTVAFSLGMVFAWILFETKDKENKFVTAFKKFRDESTFMSYVVILLMLVLVVYMSLHTTANHWPLLTSILGQGYFVDQLTSIVIMFAFIVIFILKKFDNKFLAIYGIYSFEVYLIHWPLISRYDIYFDILPAWAAVTAWIITFIVVSWLLQKITTPLGAWIDNRLAK